MKTFLTREAQWDRTAALAAGEFGDDAVGRRSLALGDGWMLGEVAAPCRLFIPGDHVCVMISNGGGERQPVCGVSGKGYPVRRLYMKHASWKIRDEGVDARYDRSPLRIVECPRGLAGLRPDDAAVRRFVVDRTRASDAARRVGASSPPTRYRRSSDRRGQAELARLRDLYKAVREELRDPPAGVSEALAQLDRIDCGMQADVPALDPWRRAELTWLRTLESAVRALRFAPESRIAAALARIDKFLERTAR